MRGILLVLSLLFAGYSALVYHGMGGAAEVPDATVSLGMELWQQENCQSCHQFYGLGGYMGPDLTNMASQRDEQRLRTFIRYGTGRMPAHALTDEQIDALIAFLHWVDRSGSSRVPDSAVHWTGTYLIDER